QEPVKRLVALKLIKAGTDSKRDGAVEADPAGARGVGLGGDEGAGEGPLPPLRDRQRAGHGPATIPGRRTGAGVSAVGGVPAADEKVTQALADAEISYQGGQLPDALAAVKRAEDLLASGAGSLELQESVRRWRTDLAMVTRLEKIRLERSAHFR